MTSRIKLYLSSYTAAIMQMLSTFSKPLHIPEALQDTLLIGSFIPLGLAFFYFKKQKKEALASATLSESDRQKNAKSALILGMILVSITGLCAPLWMPLTGTTLGELGDFSVGIIAAVVTCIFCGLKLRKT
jgi:FtsH-binding integral membrane protein